MFNFGPSLTTSTASAVVAQPYASPVFYMRADSSIADTSPSPMSVSVASMSISSDSKYGVGSAYFAGTTASYITCSTPIVFGTADFTISMWLKLDASVTSGERMLLDFRGADATGNYINWSIDTNGILKYYPKLSTTGITGTRVISANAWTHVAISRKGGVTRQFINGVQDGASYVDTTDYACSANRPMFGRAGQSAVYPIKGWMDEIVIVNGTGLYSQTFVPPQCPYGDLVVATGANPAPAMYLSGDDLSGGSVIIDASSNRFALTNSATTITGDAKVGIGAMSFNGTSSTLTPTVTAGAASLSFGTSDFTIAFWMKTSQTAVSELIDFRPSGTDTGSYPNVYLTGGYLIFAAGTATVTATINYVNTGTWQHIAVTRSSGVTSIFVNGIKEGSATDTTNYTVGVNRPIIGKHANSAQAYYYSGMLDDVVIVNGTGIYTQDFQVPSVPYGLTTGTLATVPAPVNVQAYVAPTVYLAMEGTAGATTFVDTMGSTPMLANSTSLSTDAKFGSTSASFTNASNSWLYVPSGNSAPWTIGANDFTIQAWIKPTAGSGTLISFATFNGANGNPWLTWAIDASGFLTFSPVTGAGVQIQGTTNVVNQGWVHVAVSRVNSMTRMFVNGVQDGPSSTNVSIYAVGAGDRPILGCDGFNSANSKFQGKMDDFAFHKSVGLYSTNFLPPTKSWGDGPVAIAAYPAYVAPTVYVPMDGAIGAVTVTDATGNTTLGSTVSAKVADAKFGNASISLTGAANSWWYGYNSATAWTIGTADFTIQMWLKATAASTIIMSMNNNSSANGVATPNWSIEANGTMAWASTVGTISLQGTRSILNTGWIHVAVSRSGGVTRMFVNGVQDGPSLVDTTNYTCGTSDGTRPLFGSWGSNGALLKFVGNMDDVVFHKGTGLFASNFIPPTKAYGDYKTTTEVSVPLGTAVVLQPQVVNGAWVDVSPRAKTQIGAGVRVTQDVTKTGSGSAYFDGTTWGYFSAHRDFVFGNGDFTMECWYRLNSQPAATVQPRVITGADAWNTSNSWAIIAGHPDHPGKYCLYNWNRYLTAGSTDFMMQSVSNVVIGAWTHVAVVKSGSTYNMFINGVLEATATWTGAFDTALSNTLQIGGTSTGSSATNGNAQIENLRITKTVLYSANFVPPTALSVQTPETTYPKQSYLTVWIDPSVSTSVTSASGKISAIANLAKSGASLIQATAARQPALTANVFGTKPGIDFTGTTTSVPKVLQASASSHGVSNATGFSMFTVLRYIAGPDSAGIGIMNIGTPGTVGAFRGFFVPSTGNATLNGKVGFGFWGNDYGYTVNMPVNTISVLGVTMSPINGTTGTYTLFLNGTVINAGTYSGSVINPSDLMTMGAQLVNANYPFAGQIGEVLMYNTGLTNVEVMRLSNTLMAKWTT